MGVSLTSASDSPLASDPPLLVARSPAMREVLRLVERVSEASSNVLITGECGTGKRLVARAIHRNGTRRGRPFVSVDCSSKSEPLLESALFGQAGRGAFEEAREGTIFLEAIGDIPISTQVKLLGVLQERRLCRATDNDSIPMNARVVAATNRDLMGDVRERRFLESLYYRLNVIPVEIPPLRNRLEDIPLLASYFVEKCSRSVGRLAPRLTPEAIRRLQLFSWPGNIGQLENVIERAVVLCRGSEIRVEDIALSDSCDGDVASVSEPAVEIADLPTLYRLEERYIRFVLGKVRGKKEVAARMLGISRRTLYRKEREFGWVQ